MKQIFLLIVTICLIVGCGQSYEETKRQSRALRLKLMREDSAALKIAVMPTLDCLPIFVAEERELFDTAVDIRLKYFTAQMDCDTAMMHHRVEGMITDLVRAERMKRQGVDLEYLTATNAYWVLLSNRQQRITGLKNLEDKMLAMTRYSVTDLLGELAVDSAKLKPEQVFRIQVNDVTVRMKMLENNEMDAMWISEPQLSQLLLAKHRVLLDTRQLDYQMGVIVFTTKDMQDKNRKRQMEAFKKGYRQACDSINQFGVRHYVKLLRKYYPISDQAMNHLPDSLKFKSSVTPREQDIELAQKWLTKKNL